ncbi:MAG: hypothetical protein BA872_06705 [Desulfobacterales bacterium C00003060]|nr:MAG: hypothetical protein BA861_05395 [Desulfobacterales bacterium S3730MH5]OEU80349.1 MAG: hypothetical protein BA872_06705 [Desulfobacterales bacterium C00003060]OEU82694.1 MAG: hypothetical protein BA865_15705 [Desulfobacterales bacterium S5133MH4]
MRWFRKSNREKQPSRVEPVTRGLLIFSNTNDVIQAEQILKDEGHDIDVVSPPPDFRTGCDLSIEFPLVEEPGIIKILEEVGRSPVQVVPVSPNGLKPLRLCKVKDFGQFLMVRAANMKITVDKKTQKIVNISGGGCPDVPYLAYEMVGKTLSEAKEPICIGSTLCAYSLNIAYEEMMKVIGDPLDQNGPVLGMAFG